MNGVYYNFYLMLTTLLILGSANPTHHGYVVTQPSSCLVPDSKLDAEAVTSRAVESSLLVYNSHSRKPFIIIGSGQGFGACYHCFHQQALVHLGPVFILTPWKLFDVSKALVLDEELLQYCCMAEHDGKLSDGFAVGFRLFFDKTKMKIAVSDCAACTVRIEQEVRSLGMI